MGQIVVSNVSGQGSQSLGALVNVTEVVAKIETLATEASVAGSAPVRRIRKQAWYGIGITPAGGPMVGVTVLTFQKYVEVETEDRVTVVDPPPADTLYWDVFPGGVMTFEVDW